MRRSRLFTPPVRASALIWEEVAKKALAINSALAGGLQPGAEKVHWRNLCCLILHGY
jgi:hypothetical protein